MTDQIPFDLPRATALLEEQVREHATKAATLRAEIDRRVHRAKLGYPAMPFGGLEDAAKNANDRADLLRSIAARLLSAEQDRERLDWLLANTSSLRDWRWSGDFPNGRRNDIEDREMIDEEIALGPLGKERWAARSSEGRDNG